MPVIKSAKKKLRQDKARTARNEIVAETMRKNLKLAKKAPTAESIRLAVQATDKAVKNHLLHKNKAARIKSALSKLLAGKATKKTAAAIIEAKPKTAKEKKATVKKSLSKKTSKSINKAGK